MNLPKFFDGDCDEVEARIENDEYCQDDVIHLYRRVKLMEIEIKQLKAKVTEKGGLNDVFENLFKFNINECVKHKAQDSYSEDLFILARSINQEETGISLTYQCRLMSSTKVGYVVTFLENELMSMNEFENELVRVEYKREMKRQSSKEQVQELLDYFGVDRSKTYILKDKDNPAKLIQYRVAGHRYENLEGFLKLRPVLGQGIEDYLEVNKKDFDSNFFEKGKYK